MLTFDRLTFPDTAPDAVDAAAAEQTVVVIGDDLDFRNSFAARLRIAGYTVLQTRSAELAELPDIQADCILAEFDAAWGLALLDMLKQQNCPSPVVFVAPRIDVRTAVSVLQAGALDVIEYLRNSVDLLGTVAQACAHGAARREAAAKSGEARDALARLSPRERAVMKELVKGSANKSAAMALGISPRTVEVHRTHILRKLGVRSVANLVQLAQFDPTLAA